jgi:hypothetical protein
MANRRGECDVTNVGRGSEGFAIRLQPSDFGRLAQLVARFLHTEEVIGSSPVSPTMSDNPYLGLRTMALSIEPASIGVAATAELPHVFGVVMDMGMNGGTATILAFADGTVSMYTSGGGGTIGAGEHEQIRAVAHTLLLVAEANLDAFDSATPDALPAANLNQITVLTYDGPLRATAASDDFGYDRVAGGPVFRAVHDVIAKLRELNL